MKNIELILLELERFGILDQGHSGKGLSDHLKGTYKILNNWGCEESLCLAGLCHSIYGTESYRKDIVPLSSRSFIKELIGDEAEVIAY